MKITFRGKRPAQVPAAASRGGASLELNGDPFRPYANPKSAANAFDARVRAPSSPNRFALRRK